MTWSSILIPGYAVLYATVAIGGIKTDLQDEEPTIVIGLEAITAVLTLVGYGAYHVGYRGGLLPDVWKFVAPGLVLVEIALFVRDIRGLEAKPDFTPTENVWLHTIGAWLAFLFLVPALWFNVMLAIA